jgi:CBS domain-containing protein
MAAPADTDVFERRLAADLRGFAHPLRSLVRRPPVVCRAHTSVREAVARMQQEGIGSILVVDADERAVGIFTERDLLANALDARLEGPIEAVMTREPLALAGATPAYEAALAMIERGIRHVVVIDGAAMLGVVSERDLFALQRLGLGELSIEIRRATTVEDLAAAAARVRRLTRLLVGQGVAAEPLTLYVSLLNDRISQRVIEVRRSAFELDGLAWCWLAFGSEGRVEQTFATDQDNGIVFVTHDGSTPEQARGRLLPFARAVNEALDQCGFPLCKGNVMASNPALCASLDEWQAKINGWFNVSDPRALLDASICLDFRALFGAASLADELRQWLLGVTASRQNFLRLLAENALQARSAPRWHAWFTQDPADASGTVDLKREGVRPFVDCARILSLANALPATNTADRLRAAAAANAYPAAEADAATAAFFFVQQLRLRHQATLGDGDVVDANRIQAASLNELDRRTLKEALRFGRNLQDRIALDYQL